MQQKSITEGLNRIAHAQLYINGAREDEETHKYNTYVHTSVRSRSTFKFSTLCELAK